MHRSRSRDRAALFPQAWTPSSPWRGFLDTRARNSTGPTPQREAAARLVVQTDAPSLTTTWIGGLYVAGAGFAQGLLECPGQAPTILQLTADGTPQSFTTSLAGSGVRQVCLTEGGTSSLGGAVPPLPGTRLVSLSVAAGYSLSLVRESVTRRLVVVGDSISVGATQSSATPSRGWSDHLRRTGYWSVSHVGWGYAGWLTRTAAEWASEIIASCDHSDATVYLCLGTNDYGLNLGTTAQVQQRVTDVLTLVRAALPSVTIIVQTPLTRGSEAANGSGYTLPQYRAAIAAGVTAAAVSATTIDGTTITTTLAADGVHPTEAGHAQIASQVLATVGPAIGTRYTAGTFGASTYLGTATAAGLADVGAGKSLVVSWRQLAGSTGTRALACYYTGVFGAGSGWALVVDTATNNVIMVHRPSGAGTIVTGLGTGDHSIALRWDTGSALSYSLDGGTVGTATVSAVYTPASASAAFRIGQGTSDSIPALTEEVSLVALYDYALADAELMVASSLGQSRYAPGLAAWPYAPARVLWTAQGYDPAQSSQATQGLVPITLTRTGTPARNAR